VQQRVSGALSSPRSESVDLVVALPVVFVVSAGKRSFRGVPQSDSFAGVCIVSDWVVGWGVCVGWLNIILQASSSCASCISRKLWNAVVRVLFSSRCLTVANFSSASFSCLLLPSLI